ncbi:hypothetical protein RBH26_15005 [Natronolimnohabitans sp. A-GB9]|uniref:hypothetical protein n=1 Tax=Natronolimnohabitans sp. A-GB9 TaxID=3069757 RepID=UPI0027B02D18|nr:hypothetical protein [Natronolimnohabitans sp. A-GB9]MDQ2051785.1 hypothetical protein [Natronolimnohabitans sp. A-GB9]
MELTPATVAAKADEYRDEEPLYPVEQERIEGLPDAFERGEFGWRDAEWVVRWYYRRHLGGISHEERRAAEKRFGRNDFETVERVIDDVTALSDTAEQVSRLTTLEGVDVPLASAYLLFVDPTSYIVVGEREVAVLDAAGRLPDTFSDFSSIEGYETYLESCHSVATDAECDMWTLYRALWRLSTELDE